MVAPSFVLPVVFVDPVKPTLLLVAGSFSGCCSSPSGTIKPPLSGSLWCLAVARFVVGEGGSCGVR